MARSGSITVSGNGSLVGNGQLTVGDGTGAQDDTRLALAPGSTVDVQQLIVNKATITVASTSIVSATLATNCNLVLVNSSILDNGIVAIRGNIDLSGGSANNRLCGNGRVTALGCVFGGDGALNQVTQKCSSILPTPIVCARGIAAVGCPPASSGNANERTCDQLVSSNSPNCPPLPVELILFTAVTRQQRVVLRWITASEKNSATFAVERSADGKTFRDLRILAGAGQSQSRTNYEVVDLQPLPGTSYYRLRQVDFDGTTTYSPVRTVALTTEAAASARLLVFPNPAHDAVQVVLLDPAPAAALQVYDALGRVVRTQPAPSAGTEAALPLAGLPVGIYILRCGALSQRLTVQ
ncbi:T9SS type A sorting domain-containing protein [Hymenobacter sp. BT770]|uniref:T9SS type A sorting domain-containing protein n=1 Tax=Hymenobacter sp. BT770 TaxID=2886942 RepID=UPI001D1097BA|nr:T9SS type A sorting domain-containing protein [Hymenobacter sp. BT770]MCC3153744.1 T9SS type A sorting domain-containing protein [Hymenobacter sp. BT770]MDO3413708.1 T9SS type A sorting domain-containing protein [Hymenobacter sp. BT770]